MIHILAEAATADLPKFLETFSTKGLEARRRHGCLESQIFKVDETENQIFILFKWESRKSFNGFLNDETVKETMKASGTIAPPKFTFLEKAAEFQG